MTPVGPRCGFVRYMLIWLLKQSVTPEDVCVSMCVYVSMSVRIRARARVCVSVCVCVCVCVGVRTCIRLGLLRIVFVHMCREMRGTFLRLGSALS
jgi:hypothetical protein